MTQEKNENKPELVAEAYRITPGSVPSGVGVCLYIPGACVVWTDDGELMPGFTIEPYRARKLAYALLHMAEACEHGEFDHLIPAKTESA
jgi:hypothetical protein